MDWTNKPVALFGLGDQYGYTDTFLDAVGMLYEPLVAAGAKVVGRWAGEGYDFEASTAHVDGAFVGLALDADNQSDMTAARVREWADQLKGELGL